MNLKNQPIAVVTGVARGIGRYSAEQLIRYGAKVYGVDVRNADIQGMTFFNCDIRDEKGIECLFEKISKQENRIDWLINCAGIICYKELDSIKKLSVSEWREVIDVNLTGAFVVAKYAIPLLEKSDCGNIVNLSSDKVCHPDIGTAPYAVSKAGIEMLNRILAVELLAKKIRVNTIALSSVNTDFIKDYVHNDDRFNKMMIETDKGMPYGIIEPKDVFDAIWFVLSNPKIVGQKILIDSGVLLQ